MKVVEKFLDYVSYETTSSEESTSSPSTATQLVLAEHLKNELLRVGVSDAFNDEYGYVYGSIPANTEGPAIGLIAHMDTSDQASGKDVKARVIRNYDGGDIELSPGIETKVSVFPALKRYVGKTLIVTDGTTLLGADDKAGIAEIVEIAETLVKNAAFKHGLVRICFTPDEEVGRGTEHFNYDWFKVDFAYTLDGGEPEAIEYENFNGASADVSIKGVAIHPGSAKGKLVNALSVATEFHGLLPYAQRPEYTEGYEGFNHITDMAGTSSEASMHYILRNHDYALLEKQKQDFYVAAEFLNMRYGEGTVSVKIKDAYRNMKEKFEGHMEPVELIRKAMGGMKLNAVDVAIRGGTDGATLTWNGILCPNLGTGGGNYHGVYEYVCVEDMETMVKLVLMLLAISTRK